MLFDTSPHLVPDVIKGDLDSARSEVLKFYEERGTTVIRDPDQNTNDFGKCLQTLANRQIRLGTTMNVVVFGALGGRMDHEMCNISYLYQWTCFRRIVLLSETSMLYLLPGPGRFTIIPDKAMEGPICGLLPVGAPCESISTSGLKWNLSNETLAFGSMVSSSNEFFGRVVEVSCSGPLVWMSELKEDAVSKY